MKIKLIGDVCEVIAGQSPKSSFYNKDEKGLPFYQGKKEFSEKYIGKPATWTTKVTKEAFKDDILMSVRAPVGPVNYATEHICIGRGLAAIRAGEDIDNEYLFYFLIYHENKIVGNAGAVFNSINKKQIESLEIHLPDTKEEQKQIVKTLDLAFGQIDQAKANLEQNLANAKELFASKLNEVFSQRGEGWEEKTLSCISDVRDGTHDSPKYREEGYPLITSKNLKNGKLVYDKIKYISETDYININKRSKVDIGDILFAMIGTIGNPVIIEREPNYAIKNVALFKLYNGYDSSYLKYYLDSSYVVKKMQKEAKGTTQKFVGLGYLRKFPIIIPPLPEQKQIVKILDDLSLNIEPLQTHYQQNLNNLDELKKSILEKAFKGELG